MDRSDSRLSIHHIGGRDGDQQFPRLESFEHEIVNVLYDADSDCLPQIQQRLGGRKSELHVLPYCFAGNSAPAIFNLNMDQTTSSLLELNPEYQSLYYGGRRYDWIASEALKIMEKRPITTVTLDDVFVRAESEIPPPDFLSLDTQGTEYDILQGGEETLRRNVLALVIEVEFFPLYKGAKLFGNICDLMSERGFQFARFMGSSGGFAPFRAAVGFRGLGFHLWEDALFLRKIDHISEDHELNHGTMLKKLAFISIVFNQFEYGLQCLQRANGLTGGLTSNGHAVQASYEIFLSELLELTQGHQTISRPTFASAVSYEAVKQRSRVQAPPPKNRAKDALRRVPALYTSMKRVKDRFASASRWVRLTLRRLPLEMTRSPVERLLLRYGLREQARLLKQERVRQSIWPQKQTCPDLVLGKTACT